MLKGITVASLTIFLAGFSSMGLAQTLPVSKPVKIEPVGQPTTPNSLMRPLTRPGSTGQFNNGRPTTSRPKPYPAGTPCGASVFNGQQVFVNPASIPGSYCDRDGTLQYK